MTKADTAVERIGRYRVVRRLSTGGHGEALLAKEDGLERDVVLKLLAPPPRGGDEFVRTFEREAAACTRLVHPAIVQLQDFFPLSSVDSSVRRQGQVCMVLEYVEGPPLTRLRTSLKAAGKELDDRCVIYVATRIFEALAAAHSSVDEAGVMAPVIHRDVNPSNVLVPWDGNVKVADFGVATIVGLSAAGMLKGTYGYMAPEQVKGNLVTPRSDVYAAGIILWEMLTKRRAFQRGALPEVEALRAMAEPRLVSIDVVRPDLDRSIRDAAKRALEPRAERRTITAEEMVSVLSNVVSAAEGQERLVSVLSSVRSSASSSLSSLPPPMLVPRVAAEADTVPQTIQGAPPPPPVPQGGGGRLPRPVAPPRPTSAVKLIAGASPPALSGVNRPGALRSPLAGPSAPRNEPSTTASSQSSERPRRPSASAWLAVSAPDTSEAPTQEVSATQSFIDALVKSTAPHAGEQEASELNLGTPLEALTSGRRLNDAIDEILGESRHGAPRTPRRDSAPTLTGVSSMLAEAAAASRAAEGRSAPLAAPPPPVERATAGEGARADTDAKADVPESAEEAPSTSRMLYAAPDRMDEHATGGASTEPLTSPTTRINTEPMPQYVRPPPPSPTSAAKPAEPPFPPSVVIDASALRPSPSEQPGPPSEAPSAAVARGDADSPWDSPKRSKGGAGAIAASLLVAVAAGIAGTVAYVRYQKSRAEDVPAFVAAPPSVPAAASSSAASLTPSASPPSASSVDGVSPAASVSAAEGVLPAASVSSAEGDAAAESAPTEPSLASATPSGSAPTGAATEGPTDPPPGATEASAAAASSAVATDVPPAMGVIKTTGTAPGRRIFVDKKAVGQTPASVTVKCGPHTVRLGSAGKPQSIDVPCGGQVSVSDKF